MNLGIKLSVKSKCQERASNIEDFWQRVELTILDFANATSPRGKIRKAVLGVIKPKTFEDDLPEEDDFMEGNQIKPRRRRIKEHEQQLPNHVYNDYITDIWWLISEHINPADVGRFALICKKTENIVASARFWISLYKRFYKPLHELPIDLRPDCIKRLGGLRARVIRSLYYFYHPFSARLHIRRNNFDFLNGLQCVGMWHKQDGKTWTYCFQLFNRVKTRPPPPPAASMIGVNYNNSNADREGDEDRDDDDDDDDNPELEAFLAQFNNIFENRDEGHHILVVVAQRYYPVLNFFGSQKVYLSGIRQPLSRDLTHFKLEIDFSNYRKQAIGSVAYPTVLNIRVVSWWCPDYHLLSNPL